MLRLKSFTAAAAAAALFAAASPGASADDARPEKSDAAAAGAANPDGTARPGRAAKLGTNAQPGQNKAGQNKAGQNKAGQNKSGQNKAGQNKSDREGVAEEVDPAANRQMTDEERQEAVEHFLAGYYAGYTDGYFDGADDLVIEVVETQRTKADTHAAAGHHPEKMQPERRNVRDTMRGHMRGDDAEAGNADEQDGKHAQNPQRGPTATLSGKCIGLKLVPITGTEVKHRVVRLQTEDGHRRVADLGPSDQTDKLNVAEGDDLKVVGTYVMAGDMQIVAARNVTKGGQTADVMYEELSPNFDDVKPSQVPGGRGAADDAPGTGRKPKRDADR